MPAAQASFHFRIDLHLPVKIISPYGINLTHCFHTSCCSHFLYDVNLTRRHFTCVMLALNKVTNLVRAIYTYKSNYNVLFERFILQSPSLRCRSNRCPSHKRGHFTCVIPYSKSNLVRAITSNSTHWFHGSFCSHFLYDVCLI